MLQNQIAFAVVALSVVWWGCGCLIFAARIHYDPYFTKSERILWIELIIHLFVWPQMSRLWQTNVQFERRVREANRCLKKAKTDNLSTKARDQALQEAQKHIQVLRTINNRHSP